MTNTKLTWDVSPWLSAPPDGSTGPLKEPEPFTLTSTNVIVGDNNSNVLNATPGVDTIYAYRGNDTINMGAYLTAADTIYGGSGRDTVTLDGNYSAGLTFAPTTMVGVERLVLGSSSGSGSGFGYGNSYNLTTDDATVAAGRNLFVDGSAVRNSFTFNGSAETNGQFTIKGGYGNNTITGGAGNDAIYFMRNTGTDWVSGGGGDDSFVFRYNFNAADHIDGGAGYDTAYIYGDNALTLGRHMQFTPATMVNVEKIVLIGGGAFTTNDATVAAGQTLTIDATEEFWDGADFYGQNETDGNFIFEGGAGNDLFEAGAGNNKVYTGGGNDRIFFDDHLTASDVIDGGDGYDTLFLKGDYATTPFVFGATTMVNVERIRLDSSHSYTLTTNDATVAAGKTLEIDGKFLDANSVLTFDGSAETDGNFIIYGGLGSDKIRLGAGTDFVHAGPGDDSILLGANLTAADQINGGEGNDKVYLNGDYATTPLVFSATTMIYVETLILLAGHNYNLTTNDHTVARGATLTVDNSRPGAGVLIFNGSAETDGSFVFIGGDAGDVLTGGARADTFVYKRAAQSTSTTYDTLNAVNFKNDLFDTPGGTGTIKAIDATVKSGTLSTATFDTDLAAAVSRLGAHHAMLFTPNGGTLAGDTFMVVDLNGTSGYQAGQDLVIRLSGATGTLTTGAFT